MIYKRGNLYWYKFVWQGKLVRESTKQGNDKVARQMEAAHRTRLAKELDEHRAALERLSCKEVARCPECKQLFDAATTIRDINQQFCSNHCRDTWARKHRIVPTLQNFCKHRVEPWAKASFEHTCRNNWFWFRAGIRRLTGYKLLADAKLDEITSETIAGFVAHEQTRFQNRGKGDKQGLAISSINSAIRVLRRALSLAVEWKVMDSAPTLNLLPGEQHRERVITPEEEAAYLAAAPPLLADVGSILADTGLCPDECYRLCWEDTAWVNGRNGSLLVRSGKTKARRRRVPMTPRVRAVLEARWVSAGKPLQGWVWPAPTASEHIDHSSIKKQHARALKLSKVSPFVLYSFRHTFLTRLGASGCDAWTLARIAGHSSIAMSQRYVHPGEDTVLGAFSGLGGHKNGHSQLRAGIDENEK